MGQKCFAGGPTNAQLRHSDELFGQQGMNHGYTQTSLCP
jgi:hypothetical protein